MCAINIKIDLFDVTRIFRFFRTYLNNVYAWKRGNAVFLKPGHSLKLKYLVSRVLCYTCITKNTLYADKVRMK